jgi:hypothetical protein
MTSWWPRPWRTRWRVGGPDPVASRRMQAPRSQAEHEPEAVLDPGHRRRGHAPQPAAEPLLGDRPDLPGALHRIVYEGNPYYYSVRFFGRFACKDACPSGKPLFSRVCLGLHGCNYEHSMFWLMP